MPKKLDLTDNLEKKIIEYNNSLGEQKKLQISVSQGQLLQSIIKIAKVKNILEIGSFTGYSALTMAMALPEDGSLISLDKNEDFSKKAKQFYDEAKQIKIKQIIKPALESLKELKNSKKIFDLVFIDADKENYIHYYEDAIQLVKKNGLIIIDNVLWHGEVADDSKQDKYTNIIRSFNQLIKKDNRVQKNIIPIGDGLTICVKN